MNWFERYGIVGTFFIAMIGAWLFFLFPEVCKALLNSNKTNYIVSFAGLSFLPFGYIIMVFSQRYYYLVNQKKRIHCRYWQDLPKNQRERILNFELGDNLEAFDASSEAQVEAILAYYDRMYIQDTDRNKFASTFATKRYDMIAINNGLTWAIFFSFFAATFLSYFISKNFESIAFVLKWNGSSIFIISLSVLLISLLHLSETTLTTQIFELGRRKMRRINPNL